MLIAVLCKCRLLGPNRTCGGYARIDANDPKRSFTGQVTDITRIERLRVVRPPRGAILAACRGRSRNLLLPEKPTMLASIRSQGKTRVFVCCSNPGCHHNADFDVSRLPDDVTLGSLQPRMLCLVCDHRSAAVRSSWGDDLNGGRSTSCLGAKLDALCWSSPV
jgi:hypothetical protein